MAVRRSSAVAALFLLMAGCVPVVSLNPFFPETDSFFDPGLVENWADDDGELSLVFSQSGESAYSISLTAEEKTYQLRGRLLRVGDADLLDLAPLKRDGDDEEAERLLMHLTPIHTVHRLRRDGDRLEFATLDGEWLKEKMEAGDVRTDHVFVEGILILTASTETLLPLIRRLKEQDEAFPKAGVLQRKR